MFGIGDSNRLSNRIGWRIRHKPDLAMRSLPNTCAGVRRWSSTLLQFAALQALVQLLIASSGFIVVRVLPKPEYALLAIANSMQSACQALAELGTGMGVRSIGGRIWNDPARFGQLLRTSLSLRRGFGLIAFGICLPITGWLLWRNGAVPVLAVALCLALAAGVAPLVAATTWVVSAQLHGEYKRIQKLDLGNAGLRLALVGTLCLTCFNALLTILVGALANWVQTLTLRRWAWAKTGPGDSINLQDRRELLDLSLKSLPNTIFFCFQGQILLVILTFAGSPAGIADLTALGRLAMAFQVLSVTFANVLAPRFACCQESRRLQQLYLTFVCSISSILLVLATCAWLWPDPFLLLLGDQYRSLRREAGWVVTAGCVGQIGAVMWTLNSSKAWIRFQAPGFILVTLAVQASAACLLDLRRFHDVLVFNLLSAAAPLPLYAVDAVIGLRKTRLVNDKYASVQTVAC